MITKPKSFKEQIKDAIKIESDNPAATIIEVLKKFEGKQFGKKAVEAINRALGLTGSFKPFWLCKDYGMTQLKWYGDGKDSYFSMLICHETKHVMVDTADIIRRNPAYFEAKDERNEKRSNATARKIALLARQAANFVIAKDQLEAILDDDAFEPDYHELKEIVGL